MKRHQLDPVSLVFGLLFAGLGLAFLVARIDIANTNLGWVWPLPLLALGALMIALGARRSAETTPDEERVPG
jgi:putative exporter of polyketide antibiotics